MFSVSLPILNYLYIMLNINIVTRIAADKNFFLDYIVAVHELKKRYQEHCSLRFIGAIESYPIYENILRLSKIFGIEDQIHFTKKSIPYQDMEPSVLSGYFINMCVGSFKGYASLEASQRGLKALYYNVDSSLADKWDYPFPHIASLEHLISILHDIINQPDYYNDAIQKYNLKHPNQFFLSTEEKTLLKSLF